MISSLHVQYLITGCVNTVEKGGGGVGVVLEHPNREVLGSSQTAGSMLYPGARHINSQITG